MLTPTEYLKDKILELKEDYEFSLKEINKHKQSCDKIYECIQEYESALLVLEEYKI